jgi:hypothetical protein
MNWEAVSAIGEIIGSVAVVASLAYVAIQLRQNTEMMRSLASQERVQRDFDLVDSLIENRDVAELWTKGQQDFESLDEIDRNRLIFFERRAIVHWNNMFQLKQGKQLPESDWNEIAWLIRSLGANQGLLATWNIFRVSFAQPFQNVIDEQFRLAAIDREGK